MDVLLPIALWWLAVAVIGWASLPLVRMLFPNLRDGGIAFLRPLGLLVAGYAYWLGVTLGLVPNNRAGAYAVLILLVIGAVALASTQRSELADLLRRRRRLVIGYEVMLLVVFVAWALYRAYTPTIEPAGGEKFMEMAFINAILKSPTFPPLDPWLSGFAISYYYFGYVQSALLILLTGIESSVAFNLIIPMTLAMTVVAAFGLGYDLVGFSQRSTRVSRLLSGGLTALLLPLTSSLAGLLEVGFLQGWGPARFYQWLDVKQLTPQPGSCGEVGSGFASGAWVPTRHIWWWRGSRIIQDNCREVIHEFPYFSFMLGDVHPHVMALPTVVTVMALALAVLAGLLDGNADRVPWSPRRLLMAGVVGALGFMNTWDLPTFGLLVVVAYGLRVAVRRASEVLSPPPLTDIVTFVASLAGAAVLAGKMAPAVLAALRGVPAEQQAVEARLLLAAALVLAFGAVVYMVWTRAVAGSPLARRAIDLGRFAVWLAVPAVLLYLPFYIGLSSQASGIGMVDVRSRLPQWLVHFGILLFFAVSLIIAYLGVLGTRLRSVGRLVLVATAVVALGSALLQAWTALVTGVVAGLAAALALEIWDRAAGEVDEAPVPLERSADVELEEAQQREATGEPVDAQQPTALQPAEPEMSGASAAVGDDTLRSLAGSPPSPSGLPVAPVFALTCVALAMALVLATEFVFLRDLFGTRMNTVFKVYYQAWVLLAVGGGYAGYAVWRKGHRAAAYAWTVLAVALVAAGLVYTALSIYTRTERLTPRRVTLDGLASWETQYPDDLEAARWLRDNAPRGATILEAYGGGYVHEGRMSMATGLSAVLGWEGHEHQWRGTRENIDPRKVDIERMYKTTDETLWRDLIDRYGVDYVVVGDPERATFTISAADEERYRRLMVPVFETQSGRLTIYEP